MIEEIKGGGAKQNNSNTIRESYLQGVSWLQILTVLPSIKSSVCCRCNFRIEKNNHSCKPVCNNPYDRTSLD